MKFSDGYWRLREGVEGAFPVQVLDATEAEGALIVHAPTRPIMSRGDLQGGPVVTLGCTAPAPDVIGVKITHFAGGETRGPEFALQGGGPAGHRISLGDDDDAAAEITSGGLTLRIHREPWRMEFTAKGRVLTASEPRAMGFLTRGGRHYIREQLNLGVGTFAYGLGERFGPLVKNGQRVDIWNVDSGTNSELAYKNVPFFLTNAGYGVFVNHPGNVSFEIGSEAVERAQFSVEGESMEYFLIYGPTPKEILRKYTALTGRPARLPAWSYGLWLSTSFNTSYDEETVTSFIDGMAERKIPLSVFHFDCFWMREYNWCDFEWDARHFPDPEGMLRRLSDRGLRICVWINPYIGQRSPLFEEGRRAGYLVRRPDGDVWQGDYWQPGLALVDFTNPEACEWWAGKLDRLLEMGVDCFKSDFGERIPVDVSYFDGSDPNRMHNFYAYLYNQTVFELLRKRRGEGEAIVFARSAAAGSQRFPVHWGGDCETTFAAMAESLRGGLSLGACGFGYWSHDIGGFEGTPDAAVLKRWVAFGLLSSHSRLHGDHSYRVPWHFDEESVEVLRRFTRLKMRLMPYLMRAARQAHEEGVPMMRAMALEFPGDPACTHLERQYMLGDDLLVAPVFTAGGNVEYYVPEGEWTGYLTGRKVSGGRWVRERHGFDSLPLLVRPGAVIPEGTVDDRPDYDHASGVTLRLYGVRGTATTEVGSATFTVTASGGDVRVDASGAAAGWRVLLVGAGSLEGGAVDSVEGGTAVAHEQGVLVTSSGHSLVIQRRADLGKRDPSI